jgi:hypothetical protein
MIGYPLPLLRWNAVSSSRRGAQSGQCHKSAAFLKLKRSFVPFQAEKARTAINKGQILWPI